MDKEENKEVVLNEYLIKLISSVNAALQNANTNMQDVKRIILALSHSVSNLGQAMKSHGLDSTREIEHATAKFDEIDKSMIIMLAKMEKLEAALDVVDSIKDNSLDHINDSLREIKGIANEIRHDWELHLKSKEVKRNTKESSGWFKWLRSSADFLANLHGAAKAVLIVATLITIILSLFGISNDVDLESILRFLKLL